MTQWNDYFIQHDPALDLLSPPTSKGSADGRSVVTCVCLLKAVREVKWKRGRVVVTGARRHVIIMVIVSSCQRRSVLFHTASVTGVARGRRLPKTGGWDERSLTGLVSPRVLALRSPAALHSMCEGCVKLGTFEWMEESGKNGEGRRTVGD